MIKLNLDKDGIPELRPYLIVIKDNPPQNINSTVDLIDQWKQELVSRAENGDWARPIEFRDETNMVVAAYNWEFIIGIIQGSRAVEPVKMKQG